MWNFSWLCVRRFGAFPGSFSFVLDLCTPALEVSLFWLSLPVARVVAAALEFPH